MKERKKTPAYMEALDFSRDSRIRESLLLKIKEECFSSLEDDALDFLNAAGPIDEGSHGADIGSGDPGRAGKLRSKAVKWSLPTAED